VIAGVGIDLVEIDRVASLLARHGPRFLDRILAPSEARARLERADGPAHLAGLFAAKEAVMKALGTGMAGAAFNEIAIRNHATGQPYVELRAGTARRAAERGIGSWRLSITHSRTAAAAVALALTA